MKNFVQPGKNIEYANPAAIESGIPAQIGALVGIASGKYEAAEKGIYALEGVFKIPKASGFVAAIGVAVDYDESAGEAVATTTGDYGLGKLFKPALNGELFAYVVLTNGI